MARAKKTPTKPRRPAGKIDSAETKDKKTNNPKDVIVLEDPVETSIEPADSKDGPTEIEELPVKSKTADVIEDSTGPSPTSSQPANAAPRRGFLPLVLGGLVAATFGFVASQFLGNDNWPFTRGPSATDEIAVVVDQQKAQISTLETSLGEMAQTIANPVADPQIGELVKSGEGVQAAINEFSARFESLEIRLTDLENRPIPDVGATVEAVVAYEKELAGMRAMFQKELARIEAAQSEAVQIEQSAAIRAESAATRAAFATLKAAVETGVPLLPALDALRDVGIEVPAALSEHAETGIPSQTQLIQDFPAAARAALSASISASADAGETSRLTAFLRTQLGTRSLQPQEGDDPDAVLSRAEGALNDGMIAKALQEIDVLPGSGKTEMATWIAAAKIRQEAVAAVSVLAEIINN